MKLTKKDLNNLVEFNKLRKRIGEPNMNEQEYLNYLYGKTKMIQKKTKLKPMTIPSWATNHSDTPSNTSDHIAVKSDDSVKKEVSTLIMLIRQNVLFIVKW